LIRQRNLFLFSAIEERTGICYQAPAWTALILPTFFMTASTATADTIRREHHEYERGVTLAPSPIARHLSSFVTNHHEEWGLGRMIASSR
jgi:hypothetical protein